MRETVRKIQFVHRIQNHQFQRLFLKNWLWVFGCIMVPLFLCAMTILYYSEKILIKEMAQSTERSVRNTNATLETLFDELCDTLEKDAEDGDIINFLQQEQAFPINYEFVEGAKDILERLRRERRESLYYSMDLYSEVNDYLLSSLYGGQFYRWIPDQSLLMTFEKYREENNGQNLFAALRETSYIGQKKEVITVYRIAAVSQGKRMFASISVDIQKLLGYIVDSELLSQETYLIVDSDNCVVLDTSGQMNGQILDLPDTKKAVSSTSQEINGRQTVISYMDMEYFGWKCVLMIPMEEYQRNSVRLQRMVILVILFGIIASVILSYRTTIKLFRPVETILRLIENPAEQEDIKNGNDDIQYLLVRILELFQKNITLENEMIVRLRTLKEARVRVLREQMSPHFINNVLQTISWIAIEETSDDDSRTCQSLILLADIIDAQKKQGSILTTVAEEIDYTKRFLEIERLRYGEGILCHYHIDPTAEKAMIPSISLQTLVENAIEHGFRMKHGCGNIYINIGINERNSLEIRVEDDGLGMEEETVNKIFAMLEQNRLYVGDHIGLINLFWRFLLIYGDECSFAIRKSSYGGVCVEIVTPDLKNAPIDMFCG